MKPEKIAKHLKTGNLYEILGEAKNCTNGPTDGQTMMIYKNETLVFVREKNEFYEKFTIL
ncbi:hypothetical protein EHQ58_04920 [Leptospira ognonensis]|uniref:DUF1653 domain-containing protein n=1 Tax=Leptospira ognonensis TaxID=2484945 RepID=A0A4R9K952_9LEPT|nr:hypothetical protein [Leptospira ognonensis]TGL61950.1 hypothetical protein EHQ58_04920 [Leptospira ognonensis]